MTPQRLAWLAENYLSQARQALDNDDDMESAARLVGVANAHLRLAEFKLKVEED